MGMQPYLIMATQVIQFVLYIYIILFMKRNEYPFLLVKIFLNGDRIPSTVFGGPLVNNEYEFYDAHFHWGENDCRGAEHTLNGTW